MAWAVVLTPFVTAVAVVVLRESRRAVATVSLAGVVLILALSVGAAAAEAGAAWRWNSDVGLRLEFSGFARVMAVLVPAVAAPIVAYSYATERAGRSRLVALLIAFVGAMELLVASRDFLSLLVGWELVGAFSWMLIAHEWTDACNVKAATHAFITTRVGDLGLYVAAGAMFAATGTLSFGALDHVAPADLAPIAFGVLLAATAKSAQVPFSPWLFSAMAGPTPVSALLHSATMVAAGAYILVRLGPEFDAVTGWEPAVAAIGIVTALAGGMVALAQTHVKRLLAGSTSAQYGLMFVAIGAGSTAASGAHLVAHAGLKALLFLAAGVAMHAARSPDITGMQLGRVVPRAATLSAVGALALAGVPPIGAAWTKEEIAAAAGEASLWLGAGVFVAGGLSALYAIRYQVAVFGPDDERARGEMPLPGWLEMGALGALAAGTLALSVAWLPGAGETIERVVGGTMVESDAWGLVWAVLSIAVAAVIAAVLHRAGRLISAGLPAPVRRFVAGWFGVPAAARYGIVDPVLAMSRGLARADDRVVDAGVRGAAALAGLFSRLFALRGEVTVDGIVRGIAGLTMRAARGSRVTDERAVDSAVEGVAHGVGTSGDKSRRLQTGLSHHYYVVVAVGLAVVAGVLAFAR
jgi:NADH-quinone oxidoreductase subunit L